MRQTNAVNLVYFALILRNSYSHFFVDLQNVSSYHAIKNVDRLVNIYNRCI